MGGGEDIIDSFITHPSEKLVSVFEYMIPGPLLEDDQYIVFVTQDGEDFFLYQYYKDEDTEDTYVKEELEKLYSAFDFFKAQGIPLGECSVHSVYAPYYSRILYPPEELDKKVYITDWPQNPPKPVSLWAKIVHCVKSGLPSSVSYEWNNELSMVEVMKIATIKRWQSQPIPLFE